MRLSRPAPPRRAATATPRATAATIAAAALAFAAASAVGAPAAAAQTLIQPESSTGIAGWTQTGSYTESVLTAGEGVATVSPPGGTAYELYRGATSIPLTELIDGWSHIGDPDSADGYIIDAYQGSSTGTKKMFLLTTPGGSTYQYVHTLVSGELYNNSFDAISPDTRWMVSGEWGTMSHLQVYPTPYFNSATSATGGTLNLSGYLNLSTQVSDIQGCDFVTSTELICASSWDNVSGYQTHVPRTLATRRPEGCLRSAGSQRGRVRAPAIRDGEKFLPHSSETVAADTGREP